MWNANPPKQVGVNVPANAAQKGGDPMIAKCYIHKYSSCSLRLLLMLAATLNLYTASVLYLLFASFLAHILDP